MKIGISIEMPKPRPEARQCPVELVKDLIDECECGMHRAEAFERLRRIFNRLAKSKRLSKKGMEVFEVLEPWMFENAGRSDKKVETAASYSNGYTRQSEESEDA